MHFLKSEGIIINRLTLRDADKLLTIFTPDYGKLVCYARGVHNIRSSRLTKLNIFSRIKFELVVKGNHKVLTHVDLLSSYRHNKTNLVHIQRMFQIGELINELTPEEQAQPEIYDLLETALTHLSRFSTPEYLYRFKLKLLHLLGYGRNDLQPQTIDAYIESILEHPLRTPTIF